MVATHSGKRAAEIVGCAYSNLDAWDREDLVHPSVRASGPGTRRGYTFRDLVALSLATRLRAVDVPRSAIRILVTHVQERSGLDTPATARRLDDLILATDGERVWEFHDGDSLPTTMTRTALSFVVPLGVIVRDLGARVGVRFRLPRPRER
jgi:DNA-binding transcriptional MerR regulator